MLTKSVSNEIKLLDLYILYNFFLNLHHTFLRNLYGEYAGWAHSVLFRKTEILQEYNKLATVIKKKTREKALKTNLYI